MELRRIPRVTAVYAALSLVAAAAAITLAIAGLPYGRLDHTAFAELYHGGTDTTGYMHLAIDCDEATAGTQDVCTYHAYALPPAIGVVVTLGNSTESPFTMSAFGFRVVNPDRTRLDAITVAAGGPGLDGNPDFNGSQPAPDFNDSIPPPDVVGSFVCNAPFPGDDYAPLEPAESSVLGCANGAGDGPVIGTAPPHLTLARVRYTVLPQPMPQSVPLTIEFGSVYDDTFTEMGSCSPTLNVEALCFGATIIFDNVTPTVTPTSTIPPPPTAVPTCPPADSDCDGFKNGVPPAHYGPRNTNMDYDNCPASPNSDQFNTDGNFFDQSPLYGVDDLTRANSDAQGDRWCDADPDNDGIAAYIYQMEPACNGSDPIEPVNPDIDGDRVMDGAECALGSNPTDPASKPAIPSAVDDPDNDKLSTAFEISIESDPNDIDSDDDGLQDGWEFKGYNTNLMSVETDGDGVKDGCEVASLNTDSIVNPGDQALLAAEYARPVPPSQKLANMDLNKDGVINPGDQAFQASMAMPGKCPLVTPWP